MDDDGNTRLIPSGVVVPPASTVTISTASPDPSSISRRPHIARSRPRRHPPIGESSSGERRFGNGFVRSDRREAWAHWQEPWRFPDLVPGFLAGLTPRSVVLFPERPADGRWGAGSRLVWRGLPAADYCRVVASTFATMMHRPCDASRCFQTDRFGQRVP